MDSTDQDEAKAVEVTTIFSKQEVTFDYYSCEEAIVRLNDYLDHELLPEERADVVKHLQICRPCLERFHFEETLLVSIRNKVKGLCCPDTLKAKLGSVIRNVTGQ